MKLEKCFQDPTFNVTFKSTSKMSNLIEQIGNNKLNPTNILECKGVVYKMTCKICEEKNKVSTYIGETGRKLKERIKEHFHLIKNEEDFNNKIFSATQIQRHIYAEHRDAITVVNNEANWKVEILKRSIETQNRKVMEAIEIAHNKPTLNKDSGLKLII